MRKTKFILIILIAASCNVSKHSMPKIECSIIQEILKHPEIIRILKLDERGLAISRIRVFLLDLKKPLCNGTVLNWPYKTYTAIRPSINTGLHRDIFIRIKKTKKNVVYEVYVASHVNSSNRQTTYHLEFVHQDTDQDHSIKLVGFGEYTDTDFDAKY